MSIGAADIVAGGLKDLTVIKLQVYRTNLGYFYKLLGSVSRRVAANGQFLDTMPCYSGYYKLDEPIKSLQTLSPCYRVQTGWQLKDASLSSERIPGTLTMEQITFDQYGDPCGEYANMQGLYTATYEVKDEELEDAEFTVTDLGELTITDFAKPETMRVESYANNKLIEQDLSSVVVYEDFERIFTPEFLLYKRPCSLTSKQVYGIVRAHIQRHINSAVASITSDYDFCFEVKKVVYDEAPPTGQHMVSKRRKHVKAGAPRMVPVFSMTWRGYRGNGGYEGYDCIDGWTANSLKEMEQHIKEYLDRLMTEINRPVKVCSHCDGHGYISAAVGVNALR